MIFFILPNEKSYVTKKMGNAHGAGKILPQVLRNEKRKKITRFKLLQIEQVILYFHSV